MLLALMVMSIGMAAARGVHPPCARSATNPPRLVLWAWERPEDLRFIDPREVGVAFLAGTVRIDGPATRLLPRMQPLRLPQGTCLTAVVRVETRRPALDDVQAEALASAIAGLGAREGMDAVQVDFDATLSQRAFYVEVLQRLRARLRPCQRLEITALASWCCRTTGSRRFRRSSWTTWCPWRSAWAPTRHA